MLEDFRDYLNYLEKNGKLVKVKKEVDTRFEIAAGIRKISDTDGPALLFENIKDYPGWRVAAGIYGTQKLIALALGLPADADDESIIDRYLECDEKRIKPKLVNTGPIKEIIIKGDDVDLTKLPVPIYSDQDVGPYLTAGVEVGKNHKTGVQNVSIHRRKILGKNLTSLFTPYPQHLRQLIEDAEKDGVGLPVATVIGTDPAYTIASISQAPEGVDETYIAGAFRGAPIEVVRCETIDVKVPANAEIVIEGVTIPGQRVDCGPFGEFPGNYIALTGGSVTQVNVVKVTAITMRENPIFQAMLTGMPMTENHLLKKWAQSAMMHREVSKIAEVKAINLTPGGTAHLHLVVAIKKKTEQQPKDIIDTLLKSRHGPMQVVIVDDDINVNDPVDVEWAIASRMWDDDDIVVVPGAPGIVENRKKFLGVKLGIDATAALKDKKWYQRVTVPGVDKVDYV